MPNTLWIERLDTHAEPFWRVRLGTRGICFRNERAARDAVMGAGEACLQGPLATRQAHFQHLAERQRVEQGGFDLRQVFGNTLGAFAAAQFALPERHPLAWRGRRDGGRGEHAGSVRRRRRERRCRGGRRITASGYSPYGGVSRVGQRRRRTPCVTARRLFGVSSHRVVMLDEAAVGNLPEHRGALADEPAVAGLVECALAGGLVGEADLAADHRGLFAT